FWLGMLIILGLLSMFNWLPKIGYVPFWQDPLGNLAVTIWPAASVGYRYAAVATRMMRSSLLEVMREDYIRTARAKGVWTRLIMRRHALRNALLPVVRSEKDAPDTSELTQWRSEERRVGKEGRSGGSLR